MSPSCHVSDQFDGYVADPAEPPPRRRLAGAAGALWVLALVILAIAAATLLLQGRGQEDPALSVPTEAPADGESGRGRDGGENGRDHRRGGDNGRDDG